ncbi:MAG: ATP-binding protein [Elusimicrobia bacterium]|nr:ATP-binding protein [Elusimicrobiota bacterium]
MKFIKRYLHRQALKDINEKMVFISGPRQVGKTTFAKQINPSENGYLNWDFVEHKEKILKNELPISAFWVFDEIHKYKQWRNFLKGIYDIYGKKKKILVTGSGRLDLLRFGGDSLQGRYHFLRMYPLTVAELKIHNQNDFMDLLNLGGFPEPFFSSSQAFVKRWSKEYRSRLVNEEIAGIENFKDISKLELLMIRLPELVGSPLSINSLREDLNVSHKAVSSWLTVFEKMFAILRVHPFGPAIIRAVKKECKHYHFDWTLIEDKSLRFENMVALHLTKWAAFKQDTEGCNVEIRYFRDVQGREIDFVIVEKNKPVKFIECKWSDTDISRTLKYMKKKFPDAEYYQIYAEGKKEYVKDGIFMMPAFTFLKNFI